MSNLAYRRLRAPTEDGAALIDPPLAEVKALVDKNRAVSESWDRLSGVPFSTWRKQARRTVAKLCKGETSAAALPPDGPPAPRSKSGVANPALILSGHQPTLFHPGVWFKSFLLSAIREIVDGTALNLVIDNDVSTAPSIGVPSISKGTPHIEHVLFDAPAANIPWEERPVLDPGVLLRFPEAVRSAFHSCGVKDGQLLLDQVWPHVAERARQHESVWKSFAWQRPFHRLIGLGDCLAAARHQVEREMGLKTHEAALSTVVDNLEFRSFTDHLCSRARELNETYNRALHEYRAVNGIRSHSHPVPDLEVGGNWAEVPFWIWTRGDPRRRARMYGSRAERGSCPIEKGLAWDLGRSKRGICRRMNRYCDVICELRPRALITTMYARLVLSDLFIHGIGGAKYDELTDAIIRRFFGIEPPAYVTATATFRLPIDRPQVTIDDVRDVAQKIRDVRYRPEALLQDARVKSDASLREQLAAYAAEKREYLAQHDLRRCSPERVRSARSQSIAPCTTLLQPVEQELRAEHAELIAQLKQSQLLASREFSFVLFPSEILPARLLDLCKVLS